MTAVRLMLVASEASGDALGAELAEALTDRLGEGVVFCGIGGPLMRARGVAGPIDNSALAVVGVFNALRAYPKVLELADRAAALAADFRPDAVVLIDAWGFTLRVARRIGRLSPRPLLIKYVAPQVWATRPGRARTLARAVDRLLTIHAFDSEFFEREGLATTFVGNPALTRDLSAGDGARLRARLGVGPAAPLLLLLPGSRRGEVARLLPRFLAAVDRLRRDRPALRVVLALADSVAEAVRAGVRAWGGDIDLVEGEAARFDAMRAATVALACSGTVTTELALAGCPMVVAYRLDPLTHLVAKALIRTRWITLINVAAGAFIAPELVQDRCTADLLAREAGARLDDPGLRARQAAAQTRALAVMRGGVTHPAARAAEAVIDLLREAGRL